MSEFKTHCKDILWEAFLRFLENGSKTWIYSWCGDVSETSPNFFILFARASWRLRLPVHTQFKSLSSLLEPDLQGLPFLASCSSRITQGVQSFWVYGKRNMGCRRRRCGMWVPLCPRLNLVRGRRRHAHCSLSLAAGSAGPGRAKEGCFPACRTVELGKTANSSPRWKNWSSLTDESVHTNNRICVSSSGCMQEVVCGVYVHTHVSKRKTLLNTKMGTIACRFSLKFRWKPDGSSGLLSISFQASKLKYPSIEVRNGRNENKVSVSRKVVSACSSALNTKKNFLEAA